MAAFYDITPATQILDDQGYDWSWAFVIFREIPGYPGYCVGTDGSLWTCIRVVSKGDGTGFVGIATGEWRPKKPFMGHKGYWMARLSSCSRKRSFQLHRLVLSVFVGTCPDGLQACHNNGDRVDNRIFNLRWDTPKSNYEDRGRHGRFLAAIRASHRGNRYSAGKRNTENTPRGERHYRAKLTEADVLEMRCLRELGWAYTKIAAWFEVSTRHARDVVDRKFWTHI